jgi:DNA-binding NarL/FixJ family response regulator
MSGSPITILVLDDHQVVRHGLVSILNDQPDLRAVGEARTGEEALALHASLAPDLTLVDLRLPGMSGVDFITKVKETHPDARFVVLTTFDSDEDIFQAFKAGAQACLLKDSFRDEILRVIRAVHAGDILIPKEIVQRLTDPRRAPALTRREIDVLTLVARGESNKSIAAKLGIGESTAKTHLDNIYVKLGVTDRTAATTVALARGIIRL